MKPRLLDLFCGAGGAAMGYHRAGFEVVGVDIEPQPNYPFTFWHQDALEVLAGESWWTQGFDAIHASPPCQFYAAVTGWRGTKAKHLDLVGQTRALLETTGLPWIIENVREAPIRADFMLCGSQFGLPFRRHRHFETSWNGFQMVHPCQHSSDDFSFDHGGKQPESLYRDAMGCEWMTVQESRQAIPPAYTEYIGQYLMQHLRHQNDHPIRETLAEPSG